MNVIAIDTLEVVKELKAAGFSEDQAEALTRVVRDAGDVDFANLATKADLEWWAENLRKENKAEIESLRKDTKAESDGLRKDIDILRHEMRGNISDLRSDLLKWVIGAIGFQTVAILGAVFALTHALRP